MNATPLYLTPSELVYLNGEKFAPKGGIFNKTRLVHLDFEVSSAPLAQALFAAAFLTLEQQGTLRLEIRQKKTLFGLASARALYADSVGPAAAWPQDTIETALARIAYNLAMNKGQNEVSNVVYAWLGQDSTVPVEEVFNWVKAGLAARGLLDARVQTHLKIFKSTVYACPPQTLALAAGQPLQLVQQLFGWCQQSRPEVWKMLNSQISSGIEARREKTDTDTDTTSD